jgi:DNA polymerase I-like protein with 3'-5' exonuclease and polymerase domains
LLPVHDELLLSAPQEVADEVMAELAEVMNSIVTEEEFGINVPAVPNVGTTWAEVH